MAKYSEKCQNTAKSGEIQWKVANYSIKWWNTVKSVEVQQKSAEIQQTWIGETEKKNINADREMWNAVKSEMQWKVAKYSENWRNTGESGETQGKVVFCQKKSGEI